MNGQLYPDFKLTIDNCDVEPIHRPNAIQGHGQMLVFDQAKPQQLQAISQNAARWLNQPIPTVWGKPANQWLQSDLCELLEKVRSSKALRPIETLSFGERDDWYDALAYKHENRVFLEIEPSCPLKATYQSVRVMTESLQSSDDISHLFETIPDVMRQMLGFDRVMIYKFDPDLHGSVVGEAKDDRLEPFLGLHYPATDIPPMARVLFLSNRSRSIPDILAPNSPLLFHADWGASGNYLDLSLSQLRATSPVHIEYLQHMGVRATLTLAIIQGGKLWGLFACHHYSPYRLSYEVRKMGETFAHLFSHRLTELQSQQHAEYAAESRESEKIFLSHIRIEEYYKIDLAERGDSLQKICHADGAAVVSQDQVSCSVGVVPSTEQLVAITDWLIKNHGSSVFATDHVRLTVPAASTWANSIGGMVAACVSEISRSYLFWFRLPQRQVTAWAGDPSKTLVVEKDTSGENVRLSPRKSFAKWQQAVEDKSIPWTTSELAAVERIRSEILKKEFQRTAVTVMRNRQEFMQLIYAASHDLQEPLRTQLNYLDLLSEEMNGTEHRDWVHYAGRAAGAVHRMQALIADLLDYASLGTETKREPVPLNALISEIEADLLQAVNKQHAEIIVNPLPCFKGSRAELKQLYQNLLSNALKYVAKETIPKIEISSIRDGCFVLLSVKDNGIGIDPVHFEKIFLMFQRLHGKEQYDGTGIGLALCKKIVENYDGKIWVESQIGLGSTFWLKFHESSLFDGNEVNVKKVEPSTTGR